MHRIIFDGESSVTNRLVQEVSERLDSPSFMIIKFDGWTDRYDAPPLPIDNFHHRAQESLVRRKSYTHA
jgi:hypothetical protein